MIDGCTLLIPTHNRPAYLDRCVRWFLEFGCPIVIADSSATPWSSPLRERPAVRHIHRPGGFEVYAAKIVEALAAVETPLVVLCADDDFITRDGLAQSVRFLHEHPDYAFAQGYAYLFQTFGRRLALWPMVYPHHTVEHADWIARVEHAKSTVYYGVNRTETLRAAFAFLAARDFSEITDSVAGFVDLAFTLSAARRGKLRRIDVPFGLREYSPAVSAVGRRAQTITSHNVPDFYNGLLHLLAGDSPDPAVASRLRRVFAADYAGQIAFDLTAAGSRKGRVARLPPALRSQAEYLFRMSTGARMYARPDYRRFAKVFSSPDYARLRTHLGLEVGS